jgi:siroheme synthase
VASVPFCIAAAGVSGATELAREVAQAKLGSPAVLVIGDVVRLARQTRHEARDVTEETCLQPHAA